ncbi:hypothetical protein BRADI_3g09790v3 [Brachypodium distachyon]|uniref:Uncharacterized protein n=1 Tax=Brachypodium distachyon TaxID=15368 RepID=A0A0Q3F4A6_BRADI|nr:hypothetical protein BRADI_3g09790v3 [Brachypodium distachyon]
MRWDAADAEAVLERIWDLHDRLSDAILTVSTTHFLPAPPPPRPSACARAGGRNGCVFVKGRRGGGGFGEEDGGGSALAAAAGAMAEARSLHAIRTALEDLEDHLEFLHTVQSQQLAERDAAVARLEQSRLVLATRLAEHQGKKYRVIEEALAFVGELHQVAFGSRTPPMEYRKRIDYSSQSGSSQQNSKGKHLEVYLARG